MRPQAEEVPIEIETQRRERLVHSLPRTRRLALGVLLALGPAPLAAQAQVWRLETGPRLTVGTLDGPADRTFTRIVHALRLDDGRYVVADAGDLTLRIYEADGETSAMLGGRGDGPGEFRGIAGLWAAGGDTLGVWDSRNRRITYLTAWGEVASTHSPAFRAERPPVSGNLDAFLATLPDDRIVLSWIDFGDEIAGGLRPDRMVFGLFERDGRFVEVLGEDVGMVRVVTEAGSGPLPCSPFPWSGSVDGRLAFTNGSEGRIELFGAGGDRRTLMVPGPAIPLDEAWPRLGQALDTLPESFTIRLARSVDRTLGQVPSYARMLTDSEGRIWLDEYDPASDAMPLRRGSLPFGGRWRIVDSAGEALATIDLPHDVAPIRIYDDELLAVRRDELDVERFVVYGIAR